ncbi:MAG: ABC transporter ATP-binding protein, partial [Clostridia bacterium]|nr:ABC transporter ATP-binding protein [Clostridia bacterium]
MLELKNIVKRYGTGGDVVTALDGVSLAFRENEFVSILGPSGCGKTTLLNIIGGLDQYTDGDLVINGRSTKNYTDRDFDTYRNHSIGFFFQSYNLIPHQSVLSNVELALTLSGVSRAERRRRAADALRRVGLGDQLKKKPNQMSGGQMQRVAIARALVNDPDILLADEPTGALDSETSVQIMDILREISKDKLVIMVTHNPDLAAEYSTRIIKVLDGRVTDDSAPFNGEVEPLSKEKADAPKKHRGKKTSMSFFTALALSFNNLMTKKARTFMTSFAGSIGIIGIALILSVSTGVNVYINQVQEDTLSSYPLTITAESDMVSMLANFMGRQAEEIERENEDGYVYSRNVMYDMMSSMSTKETNNLKDFKKFLDASEEVAKYASLVKYGYASSMSVYAKDPSGKIISGDMNELMTDVYSDMGVESGAASSYSSAFTSMSSFTVWQEMLPGENGELISSAITDQYEVIRGDWPKSYNEAVLVVSANNELSDYVLYSLGLKPYEEMVDIMKAAMVGEELDLNEEEYERWSFEDMMGREYRLVHAADKFQHQADGTYVDLTATETGMSYLFTNDELSTPVKIVGIIRPAEDANAATLTGAIAYTSALTDHIIDFADKNDLVTKQLENKDTDVLTGLAFKPLEPVELTDTEKAEAIKEYFASLEADALADIYVGIMCTPTDEYVDGVLEQMITMSTREENEKMIISALASQMGVTDTTSIEGYFAAMSDDEFNDFFRENAREGVIAQYSEAAAGQFTSLSDEQIIGVFSQTEKAEADYVKYYDAYMPDEYSSSTYE